MAGSVAAVPCRDSPRRVRTACAEHGLEHAEALLDAFGDPGKFTISVPSGDAGDARG